MKKMKITEKKQNTTNLFPPLYIFLSYLIREIREIWDLRKIWEI